jgi:nicotinate-nucleotide adenylyltransferase
MVSLAVDRHPSLLASDVELLLPGPSFTAVTLRRLHERGFEAWQLFFIIGTDAFAEIAMWHDYPAVLDLAHFVVIARPGQSFSVLRDRLPGLAPRMAEVRGGTAVADAGPGCSIFLVNAATPDVSSTEIRARAARGDSIEGLVAPAVERHITRHGLYGTGATPSGSGLA